MTSFNPQEDTLRKGGKADQLSFINVSNRLPVTITKDAVLKSSGGLVSALEGVQSETDMQWVGWVGGFPSDDAEKSDMKRRLRKSHGYEPVFLTEDQIRAYYNCFSNRSLWPLLHNMIPFSHYEETWYEAYREVNGIFADAIVDLAGENERVWVHDYHLMLLPSMLRKRRPDLRIGFFLHTPFPSQDVFCCHPNREDLLEGLLGADLIGFHTFGYVRHFMNTVLRVMGVESDFNSILNDSHKTTINAYPIGINAERFLTALNSDACRTHHEDFSRIYWGKKVVLNVERLDYTKGLLRRLDAIRKFLEKRPSNDDVVFLFISIPSREDVEEYKSLMDKVLHKVSMINGKFSTIRNIPVHFINRGVDVSELCALYSLADVCMVTPAIDGMNLVAKEYVACQEERKGVLILSEFAGAAQELSNALIVNPYNINQVAEAIDTALNLSEEERDRMIETMRVKVLRYDARHWGRRFLNDLDRTSMENTRNRWAKTVTLDAIPGSSLEAPLALFLDYDGTLSDLKRKPDDAAPNDEMKSLFTLLSRLDGVDVFIISGRSTADLDAWMSGYGFTLVAEHGFYIRTPDDEGWRVFDERANLGWMDQVRDVLAYHAGMTPGSTIEMKRASIVWHYRESDPEYGLWKAHQIVSELSEIMANDPVGIHHGKKIVEVGSIQISKGAVVEHLLSRKNYRNVICAGDDATDETMFRLKDSRFTRIKVGEGETSADYRVQSPGEFRRLLRKAVETLNRIECAAH